MSLIASLWTFGTLCSVDVTSQAATAVCPETILTTNRTKLACTGISIRVISFRTAYLAFASSLESEIRSNTSSNTSRWQIIPIIPDGQSRTTLNTLPIMHEQTQLARSAVKCSLTWYARWGTSLASMFGNIFKKSELTTRGTGLWESISKSRMSTIFHTTFSLVVSIVVEWSSWTECTAYSTIFIPKQGSRAFVDTFLSHLVSKRKRIDWADSHTSPGWVISEGAQCAFTHAPDRRIVGEGVTSATLSTEVSSIIRPGIFWWVIGTCSWPEEADIMAYSSMIIPVGVSQAQGHTSVTCIVSV